MLFGRRIGMEVVAATMDQSRHKATRPTTHPSSPAHHPKHETAKIRNPAELQLNEPETTVLQLVGVSPTSIDAIIIGSGMLPHQVLATIGILEMKRLIRRGEANTVARM